jgi:hypothetical protein
MTVNKIDTVALAFCKKFRLDFEMYISAMNRKFLSPF